MKKKILACSDRLDVLSGYSLQMEMLMTNIPEYEWHYVENGNAMGGKKNYRDKDDKSVENIILYPGSQEISASPARVAQLGKKLKPDVTLLYEDTQHIMKYFTRKHQRLAKLAWFPHDSESFTSPLEGLLDMSEEFSTLPVCISKNTKELCMNEGYEVEQVYNMVDDTSFHPLDMGMIERSKDVFFAPIPIESNRKVLIYVGRMNARKDIDSLLGMVAKLKEIRKDFVLIMVIDPNDPVCFNRSGNRIFDIDAQIHSRGIEQFVVINQRSWLSGGVTKRDLNVLYNMSDVYVSASGGEGFGIPICEAGACAKPFVVQDYTTGREFSNKNRNGLLAAKSRDMRVASGVPRPMVDIDDMARKVDFLLDNPKTRIRMGIDFMRWVNDNCTIEKVTKQFKELFEMFDCPEVIVRE